MITARDRARLDAEIAAFILRETRLHGYCPSYREIGHMFMLHIAEVHRVIERLHRAGAIRPPLHKARAVEVLAVPPTMSAMLLPVFEQIDAMRGKTDKEAS